MLISFFYIYRNIQTWYKFVRFSRFQEEEEEELNDGEVDDEEDFGK